MFFNASYRFFLLNSNRMSASLKSLCIFFNSRFKSISMSNMIFQQMKQGTSAIHQFHHKPLDMDYQLARDRHELTARMRG